jgi:hypothetical protein
MKSYPECAPEAFESSSPQTTSKHREDVAWVILHQPRVDVQLTNRSFRESYDHSALRER